jgi:hypothetical protein
MALHIDGGKGALRQTPVLPAKRNLTRRQARWQVDARGEVRVVEEVEIQGQGAARHRRRYQSADQRREDYEKDWNAVHGGARVIKVEMSDLGELERPVTIKAELQARRLARVEEGGSLSLRIGEEMLARGLGRLAVRRHPLALEYPSRLEQVIRLTPPAGFRLKQVPRDASLVSRFGRYSRGARVIGKELEVRTELELAVIRVEPKDYGAFRSFLLQIDRFGGERVTLAR